MTLFFTLWKNSARRWVFYKSCLIWRGLVMIDETVEKIVKTVFVFILFCISALIVCLLGMIIFGWWCPSDKEAKVAVEKYAEIKLTDDYTLDAMEYESSEHNSKFIISYIGTNEDTGKKKEIIRKKVSYSEIEEVLSCDKTKKQLEKEAESNK